MRRLPPLKLEYLLWAQLMFIVWNMIDGKWDLAAHGCTAYTIILALMIRNN